MNLNEFKNWALQQGSVGKATNLETGSFVGECVSLINQYLYKVYGISAGSWGHAKAWASPSNPIRQWFDPVTSSRPGDIGVDANGTYGHIWLYLDHQILEQNGRIAKTVTVSPDRNATVILRRKGGSPEGGNMPTLADEKIIRSMFTQLLGREATAQDVKERTGQPVENLFWDVAGSPERQTLIRHIIRRMYNGWLRRQPTPEDLDNWAKVPLVAQIEGIVNSDEAKLVASKYDVVATAYEPVKETLYRKK